MISQYNQLVPVVFGNGAIQELGQKVAELGCKKVLCVYDAGVKAAGISIKAEKSLAEAKVDFIIFDKIVPDPPVELIDEGGVMARDNQVDGVIGIGGGSSLDAAKAIALLLGHESPIAQYLTAPPTELTSSVPIILVPTTAGTGSEVTHVSVLSNTAINVKLGVFVRSTLAIVDPELTLSVPSAVTAATGLDALSHAVESITAKNWNPRSEVLALAAIQKIATNLLAAFQDGSNIQARTELCLASNWAGIAFADTDVHFGHCMADALSAAFHTPHGINCAWATPALIEMLAPALADKIRLTGEAMGISFSGNETAEKIGAMTAQSVRDLMRSVAIKSPSDMGFERQNVINCTQASLENGLCYNCPIELTEKNVQKAFAQIYDDYA